MRNHWRYWLCLPVLLALWAPPAGAGEYAPQYTGRVRAQEGTGLVNVRAGHSTRYPVLGTVQHQELVLVLGEYRGPGDGERWLAIQLPDDIPVYIHRRYLREVSGQPGVVRVVGRRVNVRSAPSTDSQALGQVDDGDRLVALGRDGDWTRLLAPESVHGWVAAAYLERAGDPALYGTRVTPAEAAAAQAREAEIWARFQPLDEILRTAPETADLDEARQVMVEVMAVTGREDLRDDAEGWIAWIDAFQEAQGRLDAERRAEERRREAEIARLAAEAEAERQRLEKQQQTIREETEAAVRARYEQELTVCGWLTVETLIQTDGRRRSVGVLRNGGYVTWFLYEDDQRAAALAGQLVQVTGVTQPPQLTRRVPALRVTSIDPL